MVTKKIYLLIILFIILIFSNPCFEVGIKVVKFTTTSLWQLWDYAGTVLWLCDPYWSNNIETSVSFIDNLYIRMEIIDFRKYEHQRNMQCKFCRDLSIDLEYRLPISRKILPIVYIGTKYGGFDNGGNVSIVYVRNREIHLGYGLTYHITSSGMVFFENQLYSDNKYWFFDYEPDELWNLRIQTWGFEKLSIGYRYKF